MRWLGLVILVVLSPWQPALAQAPGKTYRIGVLLPRSEGGFVKTRTIPELARLGFEEDRNLRVEWRYANGFLDHLPNLARELVEAQVDVIVAVSNSAIDAARRATSRIPIVMAFMPDDPVASGVIASMARPGGNITGLALLATEGDVKRFEVLAEAIPSARRMAVLVPRSATRERLAQIEQAARTKGVQIVFARAANRQEYDGAFDEIREARVSGLVVTAYPNFSEDARDLAERAAAARLPIICHWRQMAVDGCLFSYGPTLDQLGHRVADYIVRILKGTAPAEMPVEQPDRFALVINQRTARALEIHLPLSVLIRADEVIE